MQISFSSSINLEDKFLIIGCFSSLEFVKTHTTIPEKTLSLIKQLLSKGGFKGKLGESMSFFAPQDTNYAGIVVIGLGDKQKITPQYAARIGGKIYQTIAPLNCDHAVVDLGDFSETSNNKSALSDVAQGALLRSWSFDKYYTKDHTPPKLKHIEILAQNPKAEQEAFGPKQKIAEGVFLTRTLVSEPPNVMYPETMAKELQALEKLGVKVEVLDDKQMKALEMNALLGVGQGSAKPSRLVVMQWLGASDSATPPLAFVGKGVTFDTGGISLKPAKNMDAMKYDMGGAGVVGGVMAALAARKAKINVIGVVGLVENMPDGNAQRPGDIVKSMSGQTIEILNTDAEGRLLLADALWYTNTRFTPKLIVDLATLTGAIIISLGHEYAGMFSNDPELISKLKTAGEEVGEQLWHMPLGESYDKDINSPVADMKNIGTEGVAGSITAAQFLQRFVGKTPWAHLDIAGVTWAHKDMDLCKKGATGFGVRLLENLVAKYYEEKPKSA